MRNFRNAAIALMAIGGAALIGTGASAQPYGYYGGHRSGSTYSYGADRANPSTAPNGFDQDNGRDFQLRGRN